MNFFSHIKKAALIAAVVLVCGVAFAYTSPGKPLGYVSDFAHILKQNEVEVLEATLTELEKNTGSEIAVVTIQNLGGDTVENYAVLLFEEWKIGKKGQDNGALFLIAVEDREMRIEVGYGLEPLLTDAESAYILNKIVTPAFREGDYYGGITATTERIARVISGEETPAVPEEDLSGNVEAFFNWAFFVLFFFVYLGSVLARSKSWWGGGVVGGIIGIAIGIFFGFIYTGIVAFTALVLFGLLFDFIVSSTYRRDISSGRTHPWWIGGGGSSGSRGGGFGGFGGGSSGGGGASGSW